MWLRRFGVALALMAAFGLTTVACSDDDPPSGQEDMKVETGPGDDGTQPDQKPTEDTFIWPDNGDPDSGDLWPNPSDTYAATPFGCTVDADCFGLKCCPTPWGVKVCSKTCN